MATHFDAPGRDSGMAWREKRAWLGLATLAIAYGIYFTNVPVPVDGLVDLRWLFWFAAASLGQGLTFGLGIALLRWRSPRGDYAAPDERDRAIDRRAAAIAYYVLMVAVIWVGVISPFGTSAWRIAQGSLLAIVTTEFVRYGATVWSYRRGWHG